MLTIHTDTPNRPGRWGVVHQRYNWQQCRYCGRSGQDCPPVTCRACGTRQCNRGMECAICLIGLLRTPDTVVYGWTAGTCGYAGCDASTVAKAPRVRFVCINHLGRATTRTENRTVSLAEYILHGLRHRDGDRDPGRAWARFVWVAA